MRMSQRLRDLEELSKQTGDDETISDKDRLI